MGATAAVHPTDQTLQAYGLGKLDESSAAPVNRHLESCPDCRRKVAELTSDGVLGRPRDVRGGPDSGPVMSSSLTGLSQIAGEPNSVEPPPASSLPPGLADHPDYEILRELGQGGMGTVYLAQNRLMGRNEVLKVVSSHLIKRRGVLDRFLVEIRNAARLHHTNIVTAYAASRLGESIIFAMEYVEGLDLSKLVKAKGPLPVANACNYVHQACLGLQHAHEHGMVHRDIKPSNLMLARQGQRAVIKVLDFGLAKIQSEGPVDGGLTHEGQMLGTPDYVAPEQIRDARGADIRADIYSLGCTLYYLLSGGPPFPATSLYELLQAHHSMDATPLNLSRPEIPVELAALVAKMMAKEPERRFQSPGEVAQALTRFFKPSSAQPSVSEAEVSRVQSRVSPAQGSGVSPAPTQPATLGAVPAPTKRGSSKTGADGVAWESLIEIKEVEDTIKSVSPKLAEPKPTPAEKPTRRPPWKTWMLAATASAFISIVLGAVIYIATDKGRIKIVVDDPKLILTIDGETVRIEGLDEPITLRAGEHVLTVKRGDTEVETRKFTIHRGDDENLRIEYKPTIAESPRTSQPTDPSTKTASSDTTPLKSTRPGDKDRRAAEAVLSLGGSGTFRVNGRVLPIQPAEALPTEAFELLRIDLKNRPELTDAELAVFEGLPNLVRFIFGKNPKVTDAGVAHLRNLPRIEVLVLNGTSVTDDGLVHLEGLSQLTELRLENTRVTDDGLVHLVGLSKLSFLALGESRVTDAGLVHLRGLAQLKQLWLHGARVTGDGLIHLRGLAELRHLALSRAQVTDAGLANLVGLSELRNLELSDTHVTDAGLVCLRDLAKLEKLWLNGTYVTDAGLGRLKGLTWLKELNLERTNVTAAGVESLQEALPACKVRADPAVLKKRPTATARRSEGGDPVGKATAPLANSGRAPSSRNSGKSNVQKNSIPRKLAKHKADDAFQSGTIWVGEHRYSIDGEAEPRRVNLEFTVLERQGDRFKAIWQAGHRREINGAIKDGRISWVARDVKSTQSRGPDVAGTIQDDSISLNYTVVADKNGPGISGTVSLRLKK